jgi:ribonuclease E
MVTIDVNSARATKGKDIEETALATNLEAAHEIARQLRLRDLGGLVVIDFIDMLAEENQKKVEQAMRTAVRSDRARIQVSEISRFGLLELSRQRLRPSLNETYDIEHVMVRGPKSLGQSILRIIGEDAMKENTAEVHAFLPSDVASYISNEKRREIIRIEDEAKVNILIIADPYRSRPYYKVVRVKNNETKARYSFDLSPSTPDPKIDWRESSSSPSKAKPLVNVTKTHKLPNI